MVSGGDTRLLTFPLTHTMEHGRVQQSTHHLGFDRVVQLTQLSI